ncbi:hypothetical protein bmyco0003_50650 [Bacillus pseudomycoides]|nr:hypothetical protein bmyco0002_47730 [Bacillus pseudomycoides]EEM08241.1 hypothetical protein bmyco0003_50650 [Bacillus pseudomycoides]EEM13923.1 hypothetical protein bpmyx0001_52190 [Bacillus pseudomycoides DSM 12442]
MKKYTRRKIKKKISSIHAMALLTVEYSVTSAFPGTMTPH